MQIRQICAGMPDADFVKGNLSYLPSLNFVLYVGRDGRIQRFEIPSNNTSTSWNHYWIDDYWNTFDFTSYNSSSFNGFASLVTSTDGKMIYNNTWRNNVLSYFKLEACEVLNLPCNSTNVIKTQRIENSTDSKEAMNLQKVLVYPNPSLNSVRIECNESYNPVSYEIYNIQGSCLVTNKPYIKNADIDISFLPNGMFIIRTFDGANSINTKFIKQ
jgi:hypothetical protein